MAAFTHALEKILRKSTLPKHVLASKYAVRGELVQKANGIEKRITSGEKFPFKRITYCNIGNPQELGQQPISFFRQVVSLMENPSLLGGAYNSSSSSSTADIHKIYPKDAIERARYYLSNISGGTGAYSHSAGIEVIRRAVAHFICNRDGIVSKEEEYSRYENIFLSDGASPAVQAAIRMLCRSSSDGICIPIPQYPLYSASIPLLGGSPVHYYLNEEKNWELEIKELARSVTEARKKGITPRALVVINPGNPTGQCLQLQNMKEIIDFCFHERLILMADEVYQENVYVKDYHPFYSFKKVLWDLGPKYRNDFELLSFHSVSKGFIGECGKRGGYCEMTNIDEEVRDEYYKLASINLCPNIIGQIMVGLMVNPPREGSDSYPLYIKERDAIYNSLKRRASLVCNALGQLEGVTCTVSEGAMYAFPKISLPPRAVEAALKSDKAPDAFYCLELLDKTGVCVVPGSGFGQRDGTWHFRTTFLPKEDDLKDVLQHIKVFHQQFIDKYR